ncbi:hypothetical protein MASR2M64_17210 [Candidatus Cloacimonadota bacterium]
MHKYEKLLSYIDDFSTAGKEVGTWVNKPPYFPYVRYSEEMSSFINEVYQTDLMDTEYMPYLDQHLPAHVNYADYIEAADFRLLRAILTYYVRQDRFHEGLWIEATVNGVFNHILLKIKDSVLLENHVILPD